MSQFVSLNASEIPNASHSSDQDPSTTFRKTQDPATSSSVSEQEEQEEQGQKSKAEKDFLNSSSHSSGLKVILEKEEQS